MSKFVFLLLLSLSSSVSAYDNIFELDLKTLDDLNISQQKLTLNNFSVSEDDGGSQTKIKITFSVKNKDEDRHKLSVMMVGFTKNNPIWAISIDDDYIFSKTTDTKQGSASVAKGDLGKTNRIWMRVVGDF